MASGDTLFVLVPQNATSPPTNFATPDTIEDTSTPPVSISVYDFDGATDEHVDWQVTVPSQYSGATGFTFSYKGATDGSQTALVEFEFRVLILADLDILTGDLGMDTQTEVAIQDTPPTTPTNKLSYSTTGALSAANMGSPTVGNRLVIRATRDISAATNTDDFQLAEILIVET